MDTVDAFGVDGNVDIGVGRIRGGEEEFCGVIGPDDAHMVLGAEGLQMLDLVLFEKGFELMHGGKSGKVILDWTK